MLNQYFVKESITVPTTDLLLVWFGLSQTDESVDNFNITNPDFCYLRRNVEILHDSCRNAKSTIIFKIKMIYYQYSIVLL